KTFSTPDDQNTRAIRSIDIRTANRRRMGNLLISNIILRDVSSGSSHPTMTGTSVHSTANAASCGGPLGVPATSAAPELVAGTPHGADAPHPAILRPTPARARAAMYRAEFQSPA